MGAGEGCSSPIKLGWIRSAKATTKFEIPYRVSPYLKSLLQECQHTTLGWAWAARLSRAGRLLVPVFVTVTLPRLVGWVLVVVEVSSAARLAAPHTTPTAVNWGRTGVAGPLRPARTSRRVPMPRSSPLRCSDASANHLALTTLGSDHSPRYSRLSQPVPKKVVLEASMVH